MRLDRVDDWYEKVADQVGEVAASPWALIPIGICLAGWIAPLFGVTAGWTRG